MLLSWIYSLTSIVGFFLFFFSVDAQHDGHSSTAAAIATCPVPDVGSRQYIRYRYTVSDTWSEPMYKKEAEALKKQKIPYRFPYGTAMRYYCIDPVKYTLSRGPEMSTCQSNGSWSNGGHKPVCLENECRFDLSQEKEVVFKIGGYLINKTFGHFPNGTELLFIRCLNPTHQLNESGVVRKCLSKDNWSRSEPECVATCDGNKAVLTKDLKKVDVHFDQKESLLINGRYLVGTNASFTCVNNNFHLEGDKNAVCGQDGTWGKFTRPTCEPTCDGTLVNSASKRHLNVDFLPADQSAAAPTGRYLIGTAAKFDCIDPHHDLIGNPSVECHKNQSNENLAQWNGELPLCEATCGEIPFEEASIYPIVYYPSSSISGREKVSLNGRFHVNATATFGCGNAGGITYELVGDNSLTCRSNGKWTSDQYPLCIPTCDALSILSEDEKSIVDVSFRAGYLEQHDVLQERYREGTTAKFACKDVNLQLVGLEETVCMNNGSWKTFGPLKCTRTCDTEPLLSSLYSSYLNVTMTGQHFPANELHKDRYAEKTTARFSCVDQQLELVGVAETTCSSDGTWTPFGQLECMKTCTEVEITRSGDIAKEMVEIVYQDIPLERPEGWRYPLYSKVSFNCKDSTWQLVGPKSIFCLEDGLWSDKAASECVKTCGAPPVKNDGNSSNNAALESLFNPPAIDEQEQRYAVKTIVEFQCNQKIYQLNGSRTLECLPNGEWNATRPTCEPTSGSSNKAYVWIALICLGIAVSIGVGLYVFCRKRKNRNRQRQSAHSDRQDSVRQMGQFASYESLTGIDSSNLPSVHQFSEDDETRQDERMISATKQVP